MERKSGGRALTIADFLQTNDDVMLSNALKEITGLFPIPKPVGINVPDVDMGHESEGMGHVTHEVLDRMTIWESLCIAAKNQTSRHADVPEPVVVEMKTIKRMLRAFVRGEAPENECPNNISDCVFAAFCRDMMHPACPEGTKKGIAFLPGMHCFMCLWARVCFMSQSCSSLKNAPVVNRLNPFRVKLEEKGEFCPEDVFTNKLIYGAFPRFNMYVMHPSLMLVLSDGECITRVIEPRDGKSLREAHDEIEAELRETGERSGDDFSIVPAFFPAWQGFHSRGRLTLTAEVTRVLRPMTRVLESRDGADWHPLNLNGNSLSLMTKELLRGHNTENDRDFAHLVAYLSQTFSERRTLSAQTGYPLAKFSESKIIQNCVVMFPKVTLIRFAPHDPEQYSRNFDRASNEGIGDHITGLLNLYPHHHLEPPEFSCKKSWYWTLLASANMILYISTSKLSISGSQKRDCAVNLLECYAPMFEFMFRVARSLGGRIPTDDEFASFPGFEDSLAWHPDFQKTIYPLASQDDLLNLNNRTLIFTEVSRMKIKPFEQHPEPVKDPGAEKLLGFTKQEGQKYTLVDRLCDYYQLAGEDEPLMHLVAERRAACLPLLSQMVTSEIFDDNTLENPGLHFREWKSVPLSLSKVFPVKHTSGSWSQSALPDHSVAVSDCFLSISQTPCLAPSTKHSHLPQQEEYEQVVTIFHSMFVALERMELPTSTHAFSPHITGMQLSRRLLGCLLLGTFDVLVVPEADLPRDIEIYATLNSTNFHQSVEELLQTSVALVTLSWLLYLNALTSACPSIWVAMENVFLSPRVFMQEVISIARARKLDEEHLASSLYGASKAHLRPRPTLSLFLNTLSFDLSLREMNNNPKRYRDFSRCSNAAGIFSGMFKTVTWMLPGTTFCEQAQILAWMLDEAFGQEGSLLVDGFLVLVGDFISTGTLNKDLSNQWCLVAKKINCCLFVRLMLEELLVATDHAVSEVIFAGPESDLANTQKGDYTCRGLAGLQKNALSGAEASCRPLDLVVTEQNNEVQNAKRHMRGAKLTDMGSGNQPTTVIHVRLQGKPSKKRLTGWTRELRPTFFHTPGKVVVFHKQRYAFRKNTNSIKQADKINSILLKRSNDISAAFTRNRSAFVGGLSEEIPSRTHLSDPDHPATKLKVRSLVNCTECGTLVEYGLYLFGPWRGMWCSVCTNTDGSVHTNDYCCICNSVIIERPRKGKKLKTDEVNEYGTIKTRRATRCSSHKTWYNLLGDEYTTMDHFTGQWYKLKVCDACHTSNKYDRIRDHDRPLALQNLIEAMKNQRSLFVENTE